MALNGDFGNERHFPTWDTLPSSLYGPPRHWCFLAEIKQSDGFLRHRTVVMDDNQDDLIVAFYLDDYEAFDFRTLRPGHTLAIMYAEQHFFMDGTYGVRVEDPLHVKVFPCKLEKLQWLGQDIQNYLNQHDGKQKCHGCDAVKPGREMNRCGGCSHFWYCDKDCQAKGWVKNGHKGQCKVTQDAAFQALIRLDLDTYQSPFSFKGHRAISVGGTRDPSSVARPAAVNTREVPSSSTAPAVVPRGTTKVMAISLEKVDWFDEQYGLLLFGIRAKAQYECVERPESALAALSGPARPFVVLLTDGVLTMAEHAGLLDAVVGFIKGGGTAVLMGHFSSSVATDAWLTLFGKVGLPWSPGEHRRSTFHLNRAAVGEALWTQLPSSYSQEARLLKGVPGHAAWYRANEESVDLQETPVAFARVGEGNLGYVGDVNGEQGSHLAVLAMCGLMD